MACVHAATAKASTIAKCLITLSSLQLLTMANNDGERSAQSVGSRAYFCRIHPRATSAFPAEEFVPVKVLSAVVAFMSAHPRPPASEFQQARD
jgi:hypothetical protein